MRSCAKINIFLKITGKTQTYHQLLSRFYRIDNLYDEIILIDKKNAKDFHQLPVNKINLFNNHNSKKIINSTISNTFKQDCIMDKFYFINENLVSNFFSPANIFDKVLSLVPKKLANDFLNNFTILLKKNIPTYAGLGGASSNAATFIKLLNNIQPIDTRKIASLSGADVCFFESEVKSANVRGYGEIIEEINDDECDFDFYFSQNSSTKEVFLEFSKNPNFYQVDDLSKLKSKEILSNFDNFYLNDLLKPCIRLYPKAKELAQKKLFLSGSGGCFFNII